MEAALMVRPISSKRAFAYFGFMLGAMPPTSMVFKMVAENAVREPIHIVFIMFLAWAGFFTGLVGYVTGRYIPSAIGSVSNLRVPNRIAMLSLIGFVWGAISGAAGGLFLFIIGSVVAAFVGGIVGAVAVPIFAALHHLLRRGDVIEVKHFLPISFGISLLLCAFILGL
jgi:hypothetical protein